MAKAPPTHPSAQDLAAFGLGRLSDKPAEAVARHLESCPACRQAVEHGPTGSLPGAARAARPPADPVLAPNLAPELADHPRFRILRELGRGGMGVVYQAEHRMMERRVAIKVINRTLLDHPDALARFHAEVKAAARLSHPNIVAAYDAERAGDLHLLVMEFVEGVDLGKVVARRGPLPVAHACSYARQAALGLQHAFEQGMAHRDIKPQNLMLTPKGRVKVLDFGLARLRSEQGRGGGLTQQGAFMGTPEYVAPEQATDARTADIRADVYSLGCTLYALLAGRPPFAGDTPLKLVLAHLEQEPPPLREARPDAPPELAAVVARMLAKDPARRYQTPAEVAAVLAPFVRQGAAPAQKTVTSLGGSKLPPPGKGATMPATASPFGGLAEDVPSGGAAPGPARGRRRPVLLLAGAAVTALAALVVLAAVLLETRVKSPAGEATAAQAAKTPAEKWFAVGTRWEGKLVFPSQPAEMSVWFTVRSRDGNKFKGRMVGEGRTALNVEGTLGDDGTSLRYDRVRQVPNVWWPEPQSFEGLAASGKYTAERTHVDFKWPRADGQVLEGYWEFTARRDGPRNDDEDAWPPPLHPRRAEVVPAGAWRVQDGELVEEQVIEPPPYVVFGDLAWRDYDLHLKAMRTAGDQGFLVAFDKPRPTRATEWLIGFSQGRETYVHVAEMLPTGLRMNRLTASKAVSIVDNQWYDLLVQTRGQWIECFLDGESVFKIAHPDRLGGRVSLMCRGMAGRFKDIEVKAPDGKVLWEGPPKLPE